MPQYVDVPVNASQQLSVHLQISRHPKPPKVLDVTKLLQDNVHASDKQCKDPWRSLTSLAIRRRRAQDRLRDMEVKNPHPSCALNSHYVLIRTHLPLSLPILELTVREIKPSLLSPSLIWSCAALAICKFSVTAFLLFCFSAFLLFCFSAFLRLLFRFTLCCPTDLSVNLHNL